MRIRHLTFLPPLIFTSRFLQQQTPLSIPRPPRNICKTYAQVPDLTLTSLQNPRVKAARHLLTRRGRTSSPHILLEGHRLLLDAVKAGVVVERVFYTEDALVGRDGEGRRLENAMKGVLGTTEKILVREKVLQAISDTVNPQGVVAIVRKPSIPWPEKVSMILICDGVSDPGNVGTLLRTAAGASADGVVLMHGCADPWSLKVIRSAMGAHFALPILSDVLWSQLDEKLVDWGCEVCVADSENKGAVPYYKVDWTRPKALVIGSEARGCGVEAQERATQKVSIPLNPRVESLNAGVAGAVIAFEAKRQREFSSKFWRLREDDKN